MRIIKSIPKNPEFLSKYGKLLKISILLSLFCQLVSTTTESGVFYTNFSSKFSFMGAWGLLPTLLLTVGFVAGLEVGGRALVSYATDSVLYKRFEGIERFLSILVIVFMCLLLKTSLNVSIEGSPQVVEAFSVSPTLANTDSITNILQQEKQAIKSQYSADSALVATNYNSQITAVENEYRGKITKKNRSIDSYKRKEQREGKSYTTKKLNLHGDIAELESERDKQTGELEKQKGDELKQLVTERKANTATAKSEHQTEKKKIDSANNKTTTTHENEVQSNKGSLQNLVYACLFLFVLCVVVERVIYKGAGITFEYHFTDYFYREGVVSAWFSYASEALSHKAHSKIEKWHNNIPEANKTARRNKVYERTDETEYIELTTIKPNRKNLKTRRKAITATIAVENDTTPENVQYDNRSDDNRRKCNHCGDAYTYKSNKQKYCNDKCRKDAWEERTGRNLNRRKRK